MLKDHVSSRSLSRDDQNARMRSLPRIRFALSLSRDSIGNKGALTEKDAREIDERIKKGLAVKYRASS
jgi:hypothetical protein